MAAYRVGGLIEGTSRAVLRQPRKDYMGVCMNLASSLGCHYVVPLLRPESRNPYMRGHSE